MGSADLRQIHGMGGASPLIIKIAIVSLASCPDADVDHLFLQAAMNQAEIADNQNGSNLLAGVDPWPSKKVC